jgi:multiple sugar transport system permease protein
VTQRRPAAPHRRPGFWRRLRQGNLSDRQLGFLLLAPALLTLALVMLYPVVTVLWQSFHGEHLLRPWEGSPFVGVEHFRKMLWGRDMTWGADHLWPWRALGLALLLPTWWAVARRRTGVRVGLLLSAGLLLVFAFAMGFHPGEDGRWGDARFWNSFSITLLIIVVSVVGSFVVGLPLALLANVQSPLRWLGRVALLLPWAMPRVFTGLTFAWLFQSDYGVVNDLFERMGVNALFDTLLPSQWTGDRGILWLSRDVPAIVAVNLTIIWKTSSFVALILLAGLQSIDKTLYEAATVDGASAWQRFWRITLPLLRPAIAVALIFRTLTAIQTFDIPYAMTNGGPGRTLETIGLYIYNTVSASNIGFAAALSVILFLMSFGITLFYMRWIFTDD